MVTKPNKVWKKYYLRRYESVLVNFDLKLLSQHWILMFFVKGMRLVTCLAIYVTVTNMSKMALIKSTTLIRLKFLKLALPSGVKSENN